MLTFNQERHEYRWDGQVVPGVTSVLQAAGLLNFGNAGDDTLERARDRGRKVHRLCELDDKGDLVESSIDEALGGYLEAWRRFRRETNFVGVISEALIHNATYGYAGRFDDLGSLHGYDVMLDKKTGTPQRVTGLQLAAYSDPRARRLCTPDGEWEQQSFPLPLSLKRYGLHLNADGTYQLRSYISRNDFAVFAAALTLLNWKAHG